LARVARTALRLRAIDLNDREAEALTWAAQGKTSSEIGMILGMTKPMVDFHIENARLMLVASSRIHAAVKAAAGRLIEP
jgi:LuxR family transcriptional activator of conjugal transfer of Ti plasmids